MKGNFAIATPEKGKEAAQETFKTISEGLSNEGVTFTYLAKKLKKELNAHKVEVFKAKATTIERPAVGRPITTETEEVIYSKPLVAWDVRQKARQDAHKLRGDYPAEKKELSGSDGKPITVVIRKFSEEPEGE